MISSIPVQRYLCVQPVKSVSFTRARAWSGSCARSAIFGLKPPGMLTGNCVGVMSAVAAPARSDLVCGCVFTINAKFPHIFCVIAANNYNHIISYTFFRKGIH